MSTEYIREIHITPAGVYLNSKSNNDNLPYRTWRCDSLSQIYSKEGQTGLDREIMHMLCEYAELKGGHSTLQRYRRVWNTERRSVLYQEHLKTINNEWMKLSEFDRKTMYTEPTQAAKLYLQSEAQLRNRYYTALAALCAVRD